jgi:hypothetical protein
MANQSIYNAFEQMWEHTKVKLSGKSDTGHTHATTDITSGTLGVARGGTGATTFTSGTALIGNGTGAVTTRAITNMTSKSYINYNANLMTTNTLAHWNGAFNASNTSNLTYCNRGAFGTIVTKATTDYLSSTGGAVNGRIHSLKGTYTSTVSNRFGYSALEIRENEHVGTAQSDIGYAPSIGFHWSGRCAGTLVLNSSGQFQFISQAGGNATLTAGNIYENGTLLSSKYAPASHTHSSYITSNSVCSLAGISLDGLGAYIYNEGTGNIYFRFRTTSTSGYSYTNIAEICAAINAKLPLTGGTLSGNLTITGTLVVQGRGISWSSSSTALGAITWNTNGALFLGGRCVIPTDGGAGIRSNGDQSYACGHTSYLWSTVYSKNGVKTTSDEREKNILNFDLNDMSNFFMSLKPIAFTWKSNDDGKIHLGIGAQTTEQKMINAGFDPNDFDLIQHDELEEKTALGLTERYGMNYQDLNMLTMMQTQKNTNELNQLKEENQLLRKELQEIKNILNGKL